MLNRRPEAFLPTAKNEYVSPALRFWWRHPWLGRTALAIGVLMVAVSAYFQVFVRPELTATDVRFWRLGEEHATVLIDEDADRVHVTNGRDGLSDFFVEGGALVVRADEVGADPSGRPWVRLPLDALDPRFGALKAARVPTGISIGVKDCAPVSDDTRVLAAVVLGGVPRPVTPDNRVFVCGDGNEKLSGAAHNLFVRSKAVRPSRVGTPPAAADVVDVGTLPNAAPVIAAVNAHLTA